MLVEIAAAFLAAQSAAAAIAPIAPATTVDPVDIAAPDEARAPVDVAPPAAAIEPERVALLCPPGAQCVDDAILLAAILRFEASLADASSDQAAAAGAAALALAALGDPRALPTLLRVARSSDRSLRVTALAALGRYATYPEVEARLRLALQPDAPPEEAAIALPGLLAASAARPAGEGVPCPESGACVDDARLLAALVAYDEADAAGREAAVAAIASLKDARTIPFLWRQSYAQETPLRHRALVGLGIQATTSGRARQRLVEALSAPDRADRLLALDGLAAVRAAATDDALFAARAREGDPEVKSRMEASLRARDPTRLDAVLAEERRIADEAALAPDAFDVANRAVVTGAAALVGLVGGAAASSMAADAAAPGTGGCFGVWGACTGGASAGAITWFALGDRQLDAVDVGLALSGAAWGGFAGAWVPGAFVAPRPVDGRHIFYASSAGALLGLGAGAFAATTLNLDASDLFELHMGTIALDAAAFGLLLAGPEGLDVRIGYASMVAATALGVGAGAGLAYLLDDGPEDAVHTALLLGIGAAAGLFAGGAIVYAVPGSTPVRAVGVSFLGAGAGVAVAAGVSALHLTPSYGGLIYEAWAAVDGGALGLGAGLLLSEVFPQPSDPNRGVLQMTAAAGGIVLGATTTAVFHDGVPQDLGDLLLQPLLGGFALYHGAAIAAAGRASPNIVGASALLAPAAVSAALVFAAPFVDASVGDVVMVASGMTWGAYLSSMVLSSMTLRQHPFATPLTWVLGTSLAMDAGLIVGVGLNLLPYDDIGWQITYVTAVSAASTLVLALPGSLVALASNGAVTVPDVLLVSTLIGLVAGVATAPFIDFRIAPDFGLGKKAEPVLGLDGFRLTPTLIALAPTPTIGASDEPVMVPGIVGAF